MIGFSPALLKFVQNVLAEDIGSGDLAGEGIFSPAQGGRALMVAKEEGIIAGIAVAGLVFKSLEPGLEWNELVKDGEKVFPGKELALVSGSMRAILAGERTALNILQRMSAVATKTRMFAQKAARHGVKILDTRKTTPGLRMLEKYAVRVGGGINHRFGLYDAAIVKDNHIKAAGSIAAAVEKLRTSLPVTAKIEVEAETLAQVREALEAGADMIMLDNMAPPMIRDAVKIVAGRVPLEASGGITLDKIDQVAACGVDYISVGALTHAIKALDISLDCL